MGIYGISKLSILSGILLLLQIGAADRPSSWSSSSDSAWSDLRHEAQHGAPAIQKSTHLFNQKTQSPLRGGEHELLDDETLQTIDNDRLKKIEDASSDIYHRISSAVSTAATPVDTLTELSRYTTAATSTSRGYITETDLREKFGTTTNADTLTKVDTDLRTTTSAEALTEGDPKYLLSTTTTAAEILTESSSISSSGLATEQAEISTVSSATQPTQQAQQDEELATEAALNWRTTAGIQSESITEGAAKTEASTVVLDVTDYVTIAHTTDNDLSQNDFSTHRTSRTTEAVVGEEVTATNEGVVDSTSSPSPIVVLPGADVSLPEETDADVNEDDDNDNTIHVIERPISVTDGPSVASNVGAMPDLPQTTPSASNDALEDDEEKLHMSSSVTRKANDDVVTVVSTTTDEVTTWRSSIEPDVIAVTERTSGATTAEILEDKLSGIFRCTDGTLINIASLCDKKADCPDYSDEDSCNDDEKAKLTEQIHRPLLKWEEVAPESSPGETLIALDDSSSLVVVEMQQSRTEAPTTFRCEEGGNLIPISAVCDKRADCLDYSDEYNCDGSKHVTEATTTMETSTKPWTMNPKYEKSPAIEVLNEEEEEVEFFRCLDGSGVLPMSAVCDKKWDCPDFSDEDECDSKGKLAIAEANKTRPGMSWATAPPLADLPDKEHNLIIEEIPDAKGTLPEFWRCENGNYIFISSVCDKKDDCGDFSDEDDCSGNRKIPTTEAPDIITATTMSSLSNLSESGTLAMTRPMSTAVLSTPASLTLFQSDDVKSLSQTTTPSMNMMEEKYPVAMFQCDDGQEIEAMKVCDRKVDCYDGSDEDDCYDGWFEDPSARLRFAREVGSGSGPTPIDCGAGCFQCNDGTCINETLTCNGISNCLEGEDENRTTICIGACEFPNLNARVVLATGTPSQSLYLNGTVLELDCTSGSTLTGDSTITCLDGSFTDSPMCLLCGAGFFQCDDGTCINETLTCNGISNCLEGEDEDRTTICIGACKFPNLNARVVLTTGTPSQSLYLNGTVLELDCTSGSTLTGDSTITCLDGSFTASPMCLRNCHVDLNRETLICSSDVYSHGSNPTCSCESGYNLEIANENITCSDSLFIPTHPQCEETNECMLTVSPCDPVADCFNMPLGSFTCICNSGYSGNGTYCGDNDECTLGTDTCDEDATCTNTAGSYTCKCNSGFLGDGFTCIEQIYYAYGTAAGDTSIADSAGSTTVEGYSISGPLERRRLIPIGNQLFRYVHITNSGVIAFSATPIVDLSEFSHPTTFSASSSGMPAVSVFGIEANSTTTDSAVYYHIYEDTATDNYTTELLGNVSSQVNNAFSASTTTSDFTSKWAMVITWVLLRRFGTAAMTSETNTFQAVLTTDGSKTYILQLYQEASLLWDDGQLTTSEVPVIGNRISSSFLDLQSSEGYTRNQMYRPDSLPGNIPISGSTTSGRRRRNTNYKTGQFAFRLDENSDSFVNPAEYCEFWYDSTFSVSSNVPGVLPCPCTRQQAANDRRFKPCLPYSSLNQFAFGSINSFPSYLENSNQCLQQVFPSFQLSGSRCIYNRSGSLVVGYDSMWESSHLQSYLADTLFFRFFYPAWIYNDVLPRHYCCSQSPDSYFCNLYEERRPPRTCNGYQAVAQGWGLGDPHITTLDMFQYTFNGLGEYCLIRINSTGFELQGRTERAFNQSDVEVNTGTVFTSFAASQGGTTVQFDLNTDRTNMTILINGSILIDPVDLQTSGYNSSDALFNIRYDSTGDSMTGARYIVTFREGSNDVSVNVGNNLRMLDFTFQAPVEYRDGRTRGLYGVWDGDISNEVTQPDGTVLANPTSLTEEQLFDYGELWRVVAADSLFMYQSPEEWDTFNMNSFQPMFLSALNQSADPALRAAAMANCSGDTNCLFDALATNDVSIGTNTMMIGMSRVQEVVELENYPPILSDVTEINADAEYPGVNSDGMLTVIVGRSYMYQASATDENAGDVIKYSLQGNIPSNATIDPVTGVFTWTPANADQVQIGILASDGTVSRYLQLLTIVCNCANGGTCNFTSIMEGNDINNNKFAVAQCDCAPGWSGPFCVEDYNSCELNPCYPGVTCIDLPVPSVTALCADCPPSLTGSGFQCWDLNECAEMIDGCGQQCINSVGSFSCDCNAGYDLQPNLKDCIDINECDRDIDGCDENAMCINTVGSYICECNEGYILQADNRTCTDVDECTIDSMACDMNADCGNVIGSYTCTCRSGYQGNGRACEDVNECFNPNNNDCSDFATCENTNGYYVCQCLEGYEGSGLNCTDRNECAEGVSQCSLDAQCQNMPGSFMCSCNTGYTGDGNICVDIDECLDSSNNCDVNAFCTNSLGSFSCVCKDGYEGNGTFCSDIDECMSGSSVCVSTAICTNNVGSYICACFNGYIGDQSSCSDIDECEQQIDNCTQICNNIAGSFTCACNTGFELDADGSTCNVSAAMACEPSVGPCTGGGLCMNATGLVNCSCTRGFELINGTDCQDIDECSAMTDNCDTSVGNCTNTQGGYTCSCTDGYKMAADERTCLNINECETGNNNCSINANCTDLPGTYNCTCNAGFTGDGMNCTNINECDNSTCVMNSECTDNVGSYVCSCADGYVGNQNVGCNDMDECIGMPCHVDGECTNTDGSFTCTCLSGFTGNGTYCEDILECSDPNRCVANSDCMELRGSYTCICISGYRGDGTDCVDVDECLENSTVCHPQATCTNTNGSYICSCNAGYRGDGESCSNINECAEGSYDCDINSNCTDTDGSYTCFCLDGYFDMTGGRAAAGECEDVDECALEVDACDTSSVCMNTNGSYTCICNDGYMSVSQTMCTDILECSQTPNPCNTDAFELCNELVGGYECVCQASNFRVGGVCTMATTLFLTLEFVDIQGLVVEYYFDEVNSAVFQEGLADDTLTMLQASSNFSDTLAVYVESMKLLDGGIVAEVVFRVDIPITSNATENDLAWEFNSGLSGTRGDLLAPDNRVYILTLINVDSNECKDTNICPDLSMCINTVGSYSCKCLEGYAFTDNNNDTCADVDECGQNICSEYSNCTNSIGSFMCDCFMGFTGDGTECIDTDECATANDCGTNSMCNNTVGSYECSCRSGYIGSPPSSSCQDVDECDLRIDDCSQNCINSDGSYRCRCYPGFQLDADGFTCNVTPGMECNAALDPCTGGGLCLNATGLVNCTCPRGFYNSNDTHCQDTDECTEMTDDCDTLLGICINTQGGYNCSCTDGYMLLNERTCTDINECANGDNPCTLANEECRNTVGSYECVCAAGFVRTSGYCLTNSTISGFMTINLINNRLAAYTDSLSDPTSQAYMNLTALVCSAFLSTIEGWVNVSTPYPKATCEITGFAPGSFSETIVSFVITVYGESTDEVANYTSVIVSNGFSGTPTIWTAEDGTTVQVISLSFNGADECSLATSCSGVNEGCTELEPGFECYCTDSSVRFKGFCLYYTRLAGSFRYNRINGDSVTYTDALADPTSATFTNMSAITCDVFMYQIDLWVNVSVPYTYITCNITAFRPGSIIVDFTVDVYGTSQMEAMMRAQLANDNGFTGSPSNWTGNYYTIYVDELIYDNLCGSATCKNGGTCMYDIITNTTSCSCPPGFGGAVCENKVACDNYTCLNGGECEVDVLGNPYCNCTSEYTGTFCETPISCEDLDCQNNSTCELDDNGVAFCICLDGYEGNRCQLESTTGLSVGAIVGIVLGVVGFILLILLLCFCCLIVFAAQRRRQRKRELLEGADNWGYGGRRYTPSTSVPSTSVLSVPSRGAVVRNDPTEFSTESSDNFYFYQNTRGRPFGAAAAAPTARPPFNLYDDDDDDTIDSRFSGIIRNMWNMHADQRPEASFDPRELPSASSFMAGGIPRASVRPRNLYPEYHNTGFEIPYVADGTESNAYSEETEEFRTYRGRGRGRDNSRNAMDAYNYF